MAQEIKFHLDENMELAIADGLRRRGIDVTTTEDVDLTGTIDEDHLSFAESHGRVLVTRDTDFLQLDARLQRHNGIIFVSRKRIVGYHSGS